jgi:hypothetical protein
MKTSGLDVHKDSIFCAIYDGRIAQKGFGSNRKENISDNLAYFERKNAV